LIGAKIDERAPSRCRCCRDVVGGLPNDKSLEPTTTQTMNPVRAEANIKGIEADEFLSSHDVDREPTVAFSPDLLREMVIRVAFAAATDTPARWRGC
jgi:hypothetical protein